MTAPRTIRFRFILPGLFVLAAVAGCAGTSVEVPQESLGTKAERDRAKYGSVFGTDYDRGYLLFGGAGNSRDGDDGSGGATGIGVNGYLWRASLETLDFMPLVSADPFGGTIITDWYAPPEASGERFKVTTYILGRELRADGLKVSVFRQVREDGGDGGAWADAPVDPETATAIEDRILTRARELRIASLETS